MNHDEHHPSGKSTASRILVAECMPAGNALEETYWLIGRTGDSTPVTHITRDEIMDILTAAHDLMSVRQQAATGKAVDVLRELLHKGRRGESQPSPTVRVPDH